MPRRRRHNEPNVVYHLISRFVGNAWFIHEEERRQYLRLLGLALEDTDWRCLSYAIMSSHIHLGMIAGSQPPASWIREVHSPFAEMINEKHERIGAVFVRGPKEYGVRDDFVAKLIAYIHNNPVRAGVVRNARDSDWTSHAAYVGLGDTPPWLHVSEGLARCGLSSPEDLEKRVSLGDRDKVGIVRSKGRVGSVPNLELDALITAASNVVGLPVSRLRSSGRNAAILSARAVAVRCAVDLGVPAARIAEALAISEQAVASIRGRTEDNDELGDLCDRVLQQLRVAS